MDLLIKKLVIIKNRFIKLVFYFLVSGILIFIAYELLSHIRSIDTAMNKQLKNTGIAIPKDVIKLIDDLNYWQAQGGDPEHSIENIKSTGESYSKVLDLKEKLLKSGVKIKWVDGRYIIDS